MIKRKKERFLDYGGISTELQTRVTKELPDNNTERVESMYGVFINIFCNGLAVGFSKVCDAVITDLPEEVRFKCTA